MKLSPHYLLAPSALLGAALLFLSPAPAQTPVPQTPVPLAIPTATPTPIPLPAVRREMRGVWIATVDNIDWPSQPGLSVAAQKAEMIDLLDRAKRLNLNAVFFQVRPAADALYESKIEPWSEFLSGEMGRAPVPFYDPLAFTIEAAHQRGLELHAWFNPYRARYAGAKGPASQGHISRTRPDLTKTYGKLQWLDPGEPEVQNLTDSVILDVVSRYNIDGVHFDDYFYPYQEFDAGKNLIPFPDAPSRARYQQSGGTLSLEDWRRQNVNTLIERLHREIPAKKPWLRFGISPFGIWRPGFPAQIQGHDAYNKLYADARHWMQQGWVDYLVPQLYWKIEQTPQSFPVLLNWWAEQNPKNRHLWAGQYDDRATSGEANGWPDSEIEYQIRTTRGQAGASGNLHFSAKSLLRADPNGLTKLLSEGVYHEPALVPATTWLSVPKAPVASQLTIFRGLGQSSGAPIVARGGDAATWQWIIQTRFGPDWTTTLVPGTQTTYQLPVGAPPDEIAVSAEDKLGNQTAPTRLPLK